MVVIMACAIETGGLVSENETFNEIFNEIWVRQRLLKRINT